MTRTEKGFTLIEMLVGFLLASLVVGGALMALMTHDRTHTGQHLNVAMEQNLRVGMDTVTDALRAAGYGVPGTLGQWFPWVTGFSANPTISTNQIKIARCTPWPVATLTAAALTGSTILAVSSAVSGKSVTELLDSGSKRLVFIGDSETAHVTLASSIQLSIDTDPATSGSQGTTRTFPAGTPICRVDVLTFKIGTDSSTGAPQLKLDENQGAGEIALAEGITALNVTTVTAARQYRVTLTGQTERSDPMMGRMLSRSLVSDVTLRNAL
jgi:Tfp pilus assembly protein PilW